MSPEDDYLLLPIFWGFSKNPKSFLTKRDLMSFGATCIPITWKTKESSLVFDQVSSVVSFLVINEHGGFSFVPFTLFFLTFNESIILFFGTRHLSRNKAVLPIKKRIKTKTYMKKLVSISHQFYTRNFHEYFLVKFSCQKEGLPHFIYKLSTMKACFFLSKSFQSLFLCLWNLTEAPLRTEDHLLCISLSSILNFT